MFESEKKEYYEPSYGSFGKDDKGKLHEYGLDPRDDKHFGTNPAQGENHV